jgi:RHS repeat-associated protein
VHNKLDTTGQVYMRNRYYDPATGQFTQADPIGLAGGLNAYGFAAGDPVSYSDPFGLCPFPLKHCFRRAGQIFSAVREAVVFEFRSEQKWS